MFKTAMAAIGTVVAISLVGASATFAAPPGPPTTDVNVVNRTITPVQICETFVNPTDVFVVPDDRLLVIEDATVTAGILAEGEKVIGHITTTVDETTGTHFVGRIEEAVSAIDYSGRMMRLYADPGTTVRFGRVAVGGLPDITICAFGRLEQIP